MSMSPRAFPVCACLLACLAMLGACGDNRAATPRVASNNWPGYWPLYLAVRQAPEPIAHLTELRSATAVMRAFRNGAIDIAALTLDEALVLAAEGLEVCVFLVVDVSDGGDALLARPSIESVAALAGHRIGVEASAVGLGGDHPARNGVQSADANALVHDGARGLGGLAQQVVEVQARHDPRGRAAEVTHDPAAVGKHGRAGVHPRVDNRGERVGGPDHLVDDPRGPIADRITAGLGPRKRGPVEQPHREPRSRCDDGGGTPGRACSHDDDVVALATQRASPTNCSVCIAR